MAYELKTVPAKTSSDREQIKKHADRLAASYNAASGLRAGLDDLKEKSGGKIKYQIGEIFGDDFLVISTTVPVGGTTFGIQNTLRITVKSDGEITAYGDDGIEGPHEKLRAKGDAAPIVDFVKRKAKAAGFIPKR